MKKPERVIPHYEAKAHGIDTRGRDIKVFAKEPHLRSSEEKWGVPKTRTKTRRSLLLLGTGRCGTMFSTKALQVAGLPVLHEKVGPGGTVSHYFLVDSDWYPMAPWQEKQGKKHVGERRSDFVFDTVLHIVRDPRKAIPSMTKIFGSVTWKFYEENGVLPLDEDGKSIRDPLLRAMWYWYNYNLMAEPQASLTFQLERYQEAWPSIMAEIGIDAPYPAHLRPMNKTGGFKKYEPITFGDMIRKHETLGRNIRSLALSYGYKDGGVK